ncbi:MAG: hypothetical protein AB7H96_02945 [Vicinamibacterales bacterium]
MTSTRTKVTAAVVLWLVCAFLVWNVIFDRMIVLAGRRYSHDATVMYRTTGRYLLIDDVMRPAAREAFRVASVAAGGLAVAALGLIRLAAARDARRGPGRSVAAAPPAAG